MSDSCSVVHARVAHGSLTGRSRWREHDALTIRSRVAHGSLTGRSRSRGHGALTVRSRSAHVPESTMRSPSAHESASALTVRSQSAHGERTVSALWATCDTLQSRGKYVSSTFRTRIVHYPYTLRSRSIHYPSFEDDTIPKNISQTQKGCGRALSQQAKFRSLGWVWGMALS